MMPGCSCENPGLGCHGSDQLVAGPQGPVQCGPCGFLLNETVLVDAGTVGSRLHLDEQRRIRAALLTHLHFDHIRDLPTLADNLIGEIDEPVMIAAIPDVLKGLDRIFSTERSIRISSEFRMSGLRCFGRFRFRPGVNLW
jgi:glyoxylase-like metal-dependent hydrolase (beta-lactamase superfamily II)